MKTAARVARAVARLASEPGGDAFFFSRLGGRYETILGLFRSLYGQAEGFEALLARLESLLLAKYRERPEELKAADLAREAHKWESPEGRSGAWYLEPGLAAYQLYLDRFAGDLRGFSSKIPYLAELGVRLIHLMPFFKSPAGNNDGGYAVSDYLGVDPRYGSNAELAAAAAALHEREMYLAADLVLNHCADDHPWAAAARAGDSRCRGFFYAYGDRTVPDRFEAAMPEVFPETAPGNFTWVDEMQAWVMTVFHDFQWDLNWSNPELLLEMLAVLLGMANLGIDLIRLDAVPYLWKRAGTSCQNLDEAHVIARLLKACAEVVAPGVAFLAEAIVRPAEIIRYLDSGGVEECQLAYHASLMASLWEALATRKPRLLALSFGGETRLEEGSAWLSYVRCHDDIGLGYEDAQIQKAGYTPALHRRFLLDWYSGSFPGSPARGRLFMENPATGDARISGSCASLCGLEAALARAEASAAGSGAGGSGAGGIHEPGADPGGAPEARPGPSAAGELELALRRIELLYALVSSLAGIPMVFSGDELGLTNDYSWESDPRLAEDNRWMHRPRIDWEKVSRRTLKGSIEERIFSHIKRCLATRATIAAFAQDAPFELLPSPQENVLFCLRRPHDRSMPSVLVAANFAPEPQALPRLAFGAFAGPSARDLLAQGPLPAEGETVRIPAYRILWLSAR